MSCQWLKEWRIERGCNNWTLFTPGNIYTYICVGIYHIYMYVSYIYDVFIYIHIHLYNNGNYSF